MANTSCPFIHWWCIWPCTCRKSPAKVKKFIVSLVEWKLQFGLVRVRINPRRCEAWCELDEVTREKLSNTWQRSDRTSVGRFCDRHEVKPNRKFDSVQGLVDRNFRTVRPRFSIQFSISSPVIVRNRRIEPKFGLLNLSIVNKVLVSVCKPGKRILALMQRYTVMQAIYLCTYLQCDWRHSYVKRPLHHVKFEVAEDLLDHVTRHEGMLKHEHDDKSNVSPESKHSTIWKNKKREAE